jgi:hypothetical protein
VERHDIWRRVEHDYQEARRRATEGYEPVVAVHLAGQAPITLGFVETRRPPDEIWVRFEAEAPAPDEDDGVIPPECYWVHVPEGSILGIEIAFRPTGPEPRRPVGFVIPDE